MFKKLSRVIITLIFIISICFTYFVNARPTFLGYGNICEIYFDNGSFSAPQKFSGYLLPFGVKGEACVINKEDLEKLLKDFRATIIFSEEIDGGINYYAYSPKIRYRARVKGKRVNLHAFIKNDRVKVGSPVIFGSY